LRLHISGIAGQGQSIAASPGFSVGNHGNARFAVCFLLNNANDIRLPADAQRSVVFFTGNAQIVGVIRMAPMCITSWTSYRFFCGVTMRSQSPLRRLMYQ